MPPKPARALNLDAVQQQNFINYYNSLQQKNSTTVRFFDRGTYYTLHGEDAKLAADILFGATSTMKIMGTAPDKLEYICLNRANFESMLKEVLLIRCYRVEVYVNHGPSTKNNWAIEYKGSPGNLTQFEDIVFDNVGGPATTGTIAIQCTMENSNRVIGIAFSNSNEPLFELCEFVDDDRFSELEALIARLGPKECVIKKGSMPELIAAIRRNDIIITERSKADFSTDDVFRDLNRLFHFKSMQKKDSRTLPETKLTHALSCLSAIIKYFELTSDEGNFDRYTMKIMDLKRCVHLDAAAIKALNLFPKSRQTGRTHSIYGLLDLCKTQQGRRMLSRWLKAPLRDLRTISERHDIVEALVNNSETRNAIHGSYLKGIPDLPTMVKKLAKKKSTLRDCYRIYRMVARLPAVVRALNKVDDKSIRSALTIPLEDTLKDMIKFQEMVETTIEMDAANKGEFIVKPSFNEELSELHEKKQVIDADVKKLAISAAKDLKMEFGKGLKLDTTADLGYFFRITLRSEIAIRNKNQYQIIDTVRGGVRFKTDELADLNSDYLDTCKMYDAQQKTIVDEIISIASGYVDTISILNEHISKIDLLTAFAQVAATSSGLYIRPKMLPEGSGILQLDKVRHPLVEVQPKISYIPNDIRMDRDNGHSFLIITGPNMGGKSTFIRSVGVSVMLAHIGMFVPCDDAIISVSDAIFARIGANDNEAKGMSTYMVELTETAAILRNATEKSLIMIDELGRGTSTREGCGIAAATIEHIIEQNRSLSMFATHFPQLTELAVKHKAILNKHVAVIVNNQKFTLLYELHDGPSFKSCGIQLAKTHGFPDKMINTAFKKLAKMDPTVNLDDVPPTKLIKVVLDGNSFIEELREEFRSAVREIGTENGDELLKLISEFQEKIKEHENPFVQGFAVRSARYKLLNDAEVSSENI